MRRDGQGMAYEPGAVGFGFKWMYSTPCTEDVGGGMYGQRTYGPACVGHRWLLPYTPAIDAGGDFRAYLWQLQAVRVGFTANERVTR